ncbi:hypothetical protein IFM89_032739 [Coptis chinensis]|uniref:BED-type domain-containing protein n=1 Tax=Coptis chinensis TaxID=261450 RepID=A0A835LL34_9MAGN|nr:hypothetical protein IFM89_032739 [Coptis chinensis]
MDSSHNTKTTTTPKNKEVNKDKNAPLWRYVTVKEVAGPKAGGNKKWTCNFCQYDGNGSYLRVKAHLLHVSGIGAKGVAKVGPSKHWDVAMEDEFSLEPGKDCLTLDDEDEILLSFDGGDGMGNEAPNPTSTDASSSGKGKEVEDLDDSDEE